MEVRITYRSEIYLEGENLEEIKKKFESLNLDPIDKDDDSVSDYGFIEITTVEDADTYEDYFNEF